MFSKWFAYVLTICSLVTLTILYHESALTWYHGLDTIMQATIFYAILMATIIGVILGAAILLVLDAIGSIIAGLAIFIFGTVSSCVAHGLAIGNSVSTSFTIGYFVTFWLVWLIRETIKHHQQRSVVA